MFGNKQAMQAWPAAKYLTYCFWRSWILVVYTAPIWSYLNSSQGMPSPVFDMYVWSTIAFSIVAIALALRPMWAERMLANNAVIVAAGVASSCGMVMEFAGLYFIVFEPNIAFCFGAALTGVGTAFIAVRAGQIYAATRPVVSVMNTALSELASGLIFFFVVGTIPAIALFVAAFLPLAAAGMALFDKLDNGKQSELRQTKIDGSTKRASVSAFVRFLVIVFLLTLTASIPRGMFAMGQALPLLLESGIIGISFVVLVSFAIVLISGLSKSFNFGAIYYPLILLMVVAVVIVFSVDLNSVPASAVIVFVYGMFSLFMWCLLTYIARGDYWSPIQVFGFGRAIFALGSLAGWIIGAQLVEVHFEASEALFAGLLLAFLLVAASMTIFRESDVKKIIRAVWLAEEHRVYAQGEERERASRTNMTTDFSSGFALDMRTAETGDGVLRAVSEPGLGSNAQTTRLTYDEYVAEHNLTSREQEVFQLMLRGRDARTIGEALVISENTAKAHIRSIYAKTGVHTRQEFIGETQHLMHTGDALV